MIQKDLSIFKDWSNYLLSLSCECMPCVDEFLHSQKIFCDGYNLKESGSKLHSQSNRHLSTEMQLHNIFLSKYNTEITIKKTNKLDRIEQKNQILD